MSNRKPRNLFKLACKNIGAYKWLNFKICFAFAALAFLVCLFTTYNIALSQRRAEAFDQAASASYVYIPSAEFTDEQSEFIDTYFPNSERHEFLRDAFTQRILAAQGEQITQCVARHFVVECDGEQRFSTDNNVRGTAFGGEIFLPGDDVEMKSRFGLDSCYVGRLPENADEVVLGAPFMAAFGLSEEGIIGKEVALYVKGEEEPFFSGTVSGVLRSEYYELIGHSTLFRIGFILHETHPLFRGVAPQYTFPLDDWLDADTATILKDADITYAAFALINWADNLDKIQILANNLYYIIGSALAIAFVLTIFLMVDKYMRVFSRTSGILLTVGLDQPRVYALLFLQLLILCMIAIPMALVATAGGYQVINMILMMLRNVDMQVTIGRFFGLFSVGVAVVILTAVIFFVCSVFRLRNHTVKDYLSTEVR